MGFFRRFKKKDIPGKGLDVPPPPSTTAELPSSKDVTSIKAVKEAVEKPRPFPSSMEHMETKAVEKQKEELEEREDLKLTKPLFIPADGYKELLEDLGLTKHILKENEDIIDRITNFKEDQDKEFNRWESQFKDIQKKLIFVDKALFGIK
jgi:hypothetical protein